MFLGYDITVDKLWLLNEEKHNLFYQDDDFYASLRQTLREKTSDSQTDINSYRKISTESDRYSVSPILSPKQFSPPSTPFTMSPLMRQKVMSFQTPKYRSVPLDQTCLPGSNAASPSGVRRNEFIKSKSFEQVKPKIALRPPLTSSFSSDSDISSHCSPALRRQGISPWLKNNDLNSPKADSMSKSDRQVATCSSFAKKPIYLGTDDEKPSSAPNSPMLLRQRHLSASQQKSGSFDNLTERKLSVPAKTVVKFSTEIQVFQYNRRK